MITESPTRRAVDRLAYAESADRLCWLLDELSARLRARAAESMPPVDLTVPRGSIERTRVLHRVRVHEEYLRLLDEVAQVRVRAARADLSYPQLRYDAMDLARRFRSYEAAEARLFSEAWREGHDPIVH